MQDSINREVIINASKERIFEAIANPENLVKWFPDTIEGDCTVGTQPVFGFGENGRSQIYIEASRAHEYFAYRWVPGANSFIGNVLEVPNTLVEFKISEEANGSCKVTLTESGFASLPAELMETSFNQNTNGWDFMLNRLVKFFEA